MIVLLGNVFKRQRLVRSLRFGLMTGIVFMGCAKDQPEVGSHFKYDGKTYSLSKGFFENYGKSNGTGGFNLDLTLLSSQINMVEQNGGVEYLTGKGQAMYFELFSSLASNLEKGSYTFDADGIGAHGTFVYASMIIDVNFPQSTAQEIKVKSGTLTVIKNSSSDYELVWDCVLENGKNFTGQYRGKVGWYNVSTTQAVMKPSLFVIPVIGDFIGKNLHPIHTIGT
jgi:hypothetical protein